MTVSSITVICFLTLDCIPIPFLIWLFLLKYCFRCPSVFLAQQAPFLKKKILPNHFNFELAFYWILSSSIEIHFGTFLLFFRSVCLPKQILHLRLTYFPLLLQYFPTDYTPDILGWFQLYWCLKWAALWTLSIHYTMGGISLNLVPYFGCHFSSVH